MPKYNPTTKTYRGQRVYVPHSVASKLRRVLTEIADGAQITDRHKSLARRAAIVLGARQIVIGRDGDIRSDLKEPTNA